MNITDVYPILRQIYHGIYCHTYTDINDDDEKIESQEILIDKQEDGTYRCAFCFDDTGTFKEIQYNV